MTPSRSTRAPKYNYPKILDGKKFHTLTAKKNRFDPGEEAKVQRSILAMARQEDWFAVCRVLYDKRTGEHYVEVWGDMNLKYKDLPPPEVEEKLLEAGYDIRKRRHYKDG